MKPLKLDKLAGTVINDDVELIELLGEGGMGLVYRAHQRSLSRPLCIKFLRSNLVADVEWLKRFRREAAALSKVRESHIVNIYFVGLLADVYPYIAMEYVEGRSFRQIINAESSIDWRRSCRIFLQICEALSLVHSKGFVHRDLKPDNIILEGSEENEFAKILDFGICGMSEQHLGFSRLTRTTDMLGSVYYMAPECFSQPQSNPAVDIYSIGCMLCEALTGLPPFVADSLVDLAYKHNNTALPRLPDTIANEERAALEAIMEKACAGDPEQRFASCSELGQCFKNMLEERFSEVLAVRVCSTRTRNPAVGWNGRRPHCNAFNRQNRIRTGLFVLCAMVLAFCSLALWFTLTDPGPFKATLDVVQRMHLPVSTGIFAQAGAFLEHTQKPAAAGLLFAAAAHTQQFNRSQVEMQLKAVQCLALAKDDMVAQQLSYEGLVNIERLLQQSNSDTEVFARLANGFAKLLLLQDRETGCAEQRLRITMRLIALFQIRYGPQAVSATPDLFLLALRRHSDLAIPLDSAGEIFISTLLSAIRAGDVERQDMILKVTERSLNAFHCRKTWAQLIKSLVNDRTTVVKDPSLIVNMAISSLHIGLPDDLKFRLCVTAVESGPTEAHQSLLRNALRDFVASSPARLKPFETLHLALRTLKWHPKGQSANELRNSLIAYLTCPASSPAIHNTKLHLWHVVYSFNKQNFNSVHEQDDVMKAILVGDLPLPTEFAESFGRSWLHLCRLGRAGRVDFRAITILNQVDAVKKAETQSLRALLLGKCGEFHMANRLFDAAETACTKGSQALTILLLRRAEVEVAQVDFAKAERTIQEARLIEKLKDDPERASHAKYLLLLSQFGQGKNGRVKKEWLNHHVVTASSRKSDLPQVEMQLGAVKYFGLAKDYGAAQDLSAEGLAYIEMLLHRSYNSDPDALAHFANDFAKQLLVQDQKRRASLLLAKTCTGIIFRLQSRYINPDVVMSAIPDLFLLCLRLQSDLGLPIDSAGIVVADSMLLAARHRNFERQAMILHLLERSLGCFPDADRKSWAQLIRVLCDRTVGVKARSLLVEMATTSLATGLPEFEKFQLCAAAVESNPTGADRTLLRTALRDFVMSSPARLKPFESLQSMLNAVELREKGQYTQALCQNILAHEAFRNGCSPKVVTPLFQPYCELRFLQAMDQNDRCFRRNPSRLHELDDLMEAILEANSSLSMDFAEILGRVWLKMHMDELGEFADSRAIAILKHQSSGALHNTVNTLSLRALLLGICGEFAMANRLFAAAETECERDSLTLAILRSRRATVELMQLDFAKAERTIAEVRQIEKSNESVPSWLVSDLKDRLFVSLFGQGKIDFLDCYANPQKYNCDHSEILLRAVRLTVKSMRVRGDLSKARKLLERALVLVDDTRCGFLPKLRLLDDASSIYAECGQKELARACLERYLKIAVQHRLAVATDCRVRLKALK